MAVVITALRFEPIAVPVIPPAIVPALEPVTIPEIVPEVKPERVTASAASKVSVLTTLRFAVSSPV